MKLIIGILFNSEEKYKKVVEILIEKYGNIIKKSDIYPFDFTNYYEPEMGKDLKKQLLIFDKKVSKEELADIKKETTEIEKEFSDNGKRTVNIDPGYIGKEFVLASFKAKSFKKEVNGVFMHKILEFDGEIKVFSHTFPEFKVKKIQEFLF